MVILSVIQEKSLYLRLNSKYYCYMKDLNRLKVVLAEKKRTNKWLAEQLGKSFSTVSKWCTNTSQPDLQTLDKIAELLECDKRYLIAE
jgi:transcriptional regulator with XRE-family HTH domain